MARIVINPTTFKNNKDALCVAFDEGFRIIMEQTAFEPQSGPTDAQREFFADTAYADDELQLRRTIIARICTFDTSVRDPTDEQLQEAIEFLNTVLEIGAPQNEWEQRCVTRILNLLEKTVASSQGSRSRVPEGRRDGEAVGAEGGGETEDEEKLAQQRQQEQAERQEPPPEQQAPADNAPEQQTDPAAQAQEAEAPKETAEEIAEATEQLREGAEANGLRTLGGKDPLAEAGITVPKKEETQNGQEDTEPQNAAGAGEAQAQGQQQQQAQQQQNPPGVEIGKGFVKIGDKRMTRGEYEWLKRREASGASVSAQQKALLDQARNGVPERRDQPGVEVGKGFVKIGDRQMTRGEYDWLQKRAASGASLSRQQRALLGEDVSQNIADRVDNLGYRMYDDNGKKIKTRYRLLFAITGFSSPEEAGMRKRDMKNLTRLRYLGLI